MTQPIPPLIEQVYQFLKREVQWLYARKVIFDQLYCKGQLRLELLDKAAPSFFHMLQLMMYDDFQMGLARLTDSAPDKASMQQLQKRLANQGNMQLSLKTQAVLDELLKVSEPIRDHRDKMLAHYSLDHATNPDALKLPDIYYKDIEDAMDLVGEYMNLIEQHYTGWTQGYEHFAWQDDGDSLVGMLRNGLRYQEMLASQEVAFGAQDKWSAA